MKISFLGAARTVTGSKHLLTTKSDVKILLDCGLFQGKGVDSETKNRHFGLDPSSIDYLILSHAHIDHSGNIPNLVKQGFKGPIICTKATADLCRIMLTDSAHIQENDVKYINKRKSKKGEPLIKALYSLEDVEIALEQLVPIRYNESYKFCEEATLTFTDAGHILGSAAVNIEYLEDGILKHICYTGDIGRYNGSILRDPQIFPQAATIIAESTYGDRLHTDINMSEQQLFNVVYNTILEKKGKLIIPAFSLGRTQELVYALDQMETKKMLPKIKVYVDSPLSINATEIMRQNPECFNEEILKYMEKDPNPFGFGNLIYIRDAEDSKKLNDLEEPCIIISASGMIEAGRIKHHIANNISDEKNTILMVGYAEPNSIGGRIRGGAKTIKIFGEEHEIKANVVIMDSYSAHGDYDEMIKYLNCQNKNLVKDLFLVHGEYETQLKYKKKLIENGFKKITIPEQGEEFEI